MTASSIADSIQRFPNSCWMKDDLLRNAALNRLQSSGYAALRKLQCDVTDGVVTVYGIVSSYYLKQMAQTLLQRLNGIQTVTNSVVVQALKAPI